MKKEKIKYCKNCGSPLSDDRAFCDSCGRKVKENGYWIEKAVYEKAHEKPKKKPHKKSKLPKKIISVVITRLKNPIVAFILSMNTPILISVIVPGEVGVVLSIVFGVIFFGLTLFDLLWLLR